MQRESERSISKFVYTSKLPMTAENVIDFICKTLLLRGYNGPIICDIDIKFDGLSKILRMYTSDLSFFYMHTILTVQGVFSVSPSKCTFFSRLEWNLFLIKPQFKV